MERGELSNRSREEIVMLKPNLYGVGIDLRALGRKWFGRD
jgi:hypothetical protein